MSIREYAYNLLNDFQKEIYHECIYLGTGCLNVPKGTGKTLLSIVVALNLSNEPILVVCAKSLVSTWLSEIQKFFRKRLKVEVAHRDFFRNIDDWTIAPDTDLVITTSDTLGLLFKKYNLEKNLVEKRVVIPPTLTNFYYRPEHPVTQTRQGLISLLSRKWGCLIVDECQQHTKISSNKGKGLCLVQADHVWLTSGDPITTADLERLMGYFLLINADTPHTLPELKKHLHSKNFFEAGGTAATMVYRERNEAFDDTRPKLHRIITEHGMKKEEKQIYLMFKTLIQNLNVEIKRIKQQREIDPDNRDDDLKKVSTYLLAMIGHLRQAIVSPITPIANCALQMSNSTARNEIADFINTEIAKLGIYDWLNSEACLKSSRITKMLEIIGNLPKSRVIIFSSYRTSLTLCQYFVQTEFPERVCLTIESKMNSSAREEVLRTFREDPSTVLMLTYPIGSTGLNLQCCQHSIFMDFDWLPQTTSQAECRTYRMGQKEKEVFMYYLTSNTGVEKGILQKQLEKKKMVEELFSGNMKTKKKSMKSEEMVKLVTNEDNISLINEVYM